ncbi:MAG: hypothetical protein U5J63_10055 [Fodinibius sp.]|nr:hypothetical protein [Fodinibius sp.]
MSINLRKDSRKLHRWGAILIALPFLIVLLSGLFLQVKKEFSWIQPPSQSGSAVGASVPFDSVLTIAKSVPELKVQQWTDIDRLDVRPDDGIIKIRGTNGWEAQIDSHSGKYCRWRNAGLILSRPSMTARGSTTRRNFGFFYRQL